MNARIVALLLTAGLLTSVTTLAQSTPEPGKTVTVGPYQFSYDPKEPLQAFPVARTTNGDGSFVTYYVAVQLADGSVTGLTPCDDVAVLCAPIIGPAKAAFQTADSGDSFSLSKEEVAQ